MREELRKLFDKKGKVVASMEAIGKTVKDGKGTLTDEQRTQLRTYNNELKELDLKIKDEEILQQMDAAKGVKEGTRVTEGEERSQEDKDDEKRNYNFDFTIAQKASVKHGPITEWRLRNFDVNEKMQRANVYDVMIAMHPMAKKPTNPAIIHALDECRAATTSAMLTEYLSAQLLDGGLAKSRLAQAGMQTQVMEEGTKRFAKITTYPTFEWKAESAQTTDRTVVFDSVDMEAHTLRGFLNVSGEQVQDCHNIDAALRMAFRRSIANGIDYAGLFGAGGATEEPEGIYNYTNVNRHDLGAVPTGFDSFIDCSKLILDDNGELPDTTIYSPGSWALFNKLKQGTSNAPLPMPLYMTMQNSDKGHRFYETTQVPDDLDETLYNTCAFMGGFRSVNLGVRLQTQIILTPVQADRYQWSYLTVFRGDIRPYREEDLGVVDNIWLQEHT